MNERLKERRTNWGNSIISGLLLMFVLVWTLPSIGQVPADGEEPSIESNQQENENSESEDSVEGTPSKETDDQNPSGDSQPKATAPASSVSGQAPQPPSPSLPVTILSVPVPDSARRAMDIKRDRGDLPALGKLADVKALLLDPTPPSVYSDVILKRIAALNESSHAQGNPNLVGTLLENAPAEEILTALELGETANLILADYSLSGTFPPSAHFDQAVLTGNNFAADVTSVWDHLSSDAFPSASYSAVIGRNLSLTEPQESYSHKSLVDPSEDTFLLAATSVLSYSGSISFADSSTRIVLIGGDVVSTASGSELDAALADLVVASRSDWSVSDAAFAAGSKLYLRSLDSLALTNIDLTATDQVRLEALMDLSLDNARFSAEVREIQMHATTIYLQNVDFPSSSDIHLHTLRGGLEGKYPTFGPTETRAYGRVNFLQNVSHGGNVLNDRTSFDLHGTKIKISKLP